MRHDLIKVSAAGTSRNRAKRPEFLRCLKRGGGLFPTPSRGLRGHFPARGAREPFQEQFKRADVRTPAAFPRLARYPGTKVSALGPGARGWASGVPARPQSSTPSPRRGRGCGRTTRKRGAPEVAAQRPRALLCPQSARARGAAWRQGRGRRRALAYRPGRRLAPLPLPSLRPAVLLLLLSPPPSESRALL